MLGSEDAFAALVTLGCLVCAGVFVLIAWDGMNVLASDRSIDPLIHRSMIPFIHLSDLSIFLGLRLREVDLAPVGAFDGITSDMFSTEGPTDA